MTHRIMYAECHENGYATAVSMGGRAARLFDFQWLARSDAGSLFLRVMFSGPREKKPRSSPRRTSCTFRLKRRRCAVSSARPTTVMLRGWGAGCEARAGKGATNRERRPVKLGDLRRGRPKLGPKRGMQRPSVGFGNWSLNTINQAEPCLGHSQEVLLVLIVGGFVC